MYKVIFSEKAKKQLKKLEKSTSERIIATLERIRIRPETYLQKLTDDPAYKLRVGDYRIIIDLEKRMLLILVIKVGHRRNIYKS
tara:strand:+ start:881 stop:1132 length:252 start_codon:yes stop_codon:yes gene_type:complete